jgi:hypothetical protein
MNVDVELITRVESEGYETLISDYSLHKYIRNLLHFLFPDSSITWCLKVYNFVKKKKCITIITSPPHGLIYLSVFLSRIKNIKVIHDFRDPFTTNAHPSKNIYPRKILNEKIEKVLVKSDVRIIFNTLEHSKIFLHKHGANFHFNVVNNGYIYEDISERKRTKKMVYFGGHYGGTVSKVLVNFVKSINENEKMELDIYGEFDSIYLDAKNINYLGMKNRAELKELLLDYEIGLVCYSNHFEGRGVSTKFYEILGLGLVPFCINPSNDLLNILKDLGFGGYTYESDLSKSYKSLKEITAIKLDKEDLKKIRNYSRNNQNNKFLEIINTY